MSCSFGLEWLFKNLWLFDNGDMSDLDLITEVDRFKFSSCFQSSQIDGSCDGKFVNLFSFFNDDDHQLKIFFCQNEMDKCEKNDTHTHKFPTTKTLVGLDFLLLFPFYIDVSTLDIIFSFGKKPRNMMQNL